MQQRREVNVFQVGVQFIGEVKTFDQENIAVEIVKVKLDIKAIQLKQKNSEVARFAVTQVNAVVQYTPALLFLVQCIKVLQRHQANV